MTYPYSHETTDYGITGETVAPGQTHGVTLPSPLDDVDFKETVLLAASTILQYGEQCADTDGMAKYLVSDGHEDDQLQARIARKEAANEALVQRVFAAERKAADWEAECRRLSAVLVEKEQALAQLMAIPANALKHGR